MDNQATPGIGDNLADPIAVLQDELTVRAQPLLTRRDELMEAAARMPPAVTSAEVAEGYATMIGLLRSVSKKANATRIAEKDPHLRAGNAVDAFFKKKLIEPCDERADKIEATLNGYQREQKRIADAAAAEARRKADEEARRALMAAEAARLEAERVKRENEERAERERKEAAALAAAAAAAVETEGDLALAIEAEEQARAAAAEKEKRDAEAAAAAKAAEEAAQRAADDAAALAEAARREAETAPKQAAQVRSGTGQLASLRSVWTFKELNRDTIDLEFLRPYLATADIEKAVRAAIKAGARQIKGCQIFEDFPTQVRR